MSDLLTITEVARRLGVKPGAVRSAVRGQRIGGVIVRLEPDVVVGRQLRFSVQTIDAWQAEAKAARRAAADAPPPARCGVIRMPSHRRAQASNRGIA